MPSLIGEETRNFLREPSDAGATHPLRKMDGGGVLEQGNAGVVW
jgi:hypothetical protein